jgi:hypothetical protein
MAVSRILRRAGACLVLSFAVLLGACASGGGMSGGGQGSVALEVENNLIPPTSLSVYALPEIGSRQLVGIVQPGRTRVLRFDPVGASGQYRFMAETTEGREIVSNPLTISSGATVSWDVNSNLATASGG